MAQFTTTRRPQFWCKNPSECYRSKDKIPELWKGLHVNCCFFFYTEDFAGRIGIMLFNFTPLWSPDIFYNHASRSQKGKMLRWNKHEGQQADLASQPQCSECSLQANKINKKPRDKMHSFYSEFFSSIRFLPLLTTTTTTTLLNQIIIVNGWPTPQIARKKS